MHHCNDLISFSSMFLSIIKFGLIYYVNFHLLPYTIAIIIIKEVKKTDLKWRFETKCIMLHNFYLLVLNDNGSIMRFLTRKNLGLIDRVAVG